MNTGKKYKTKQKSRILECIQNHRESYVTIRQIQQDLKAQGENIGLTTIYRNLDLLLSEQLITKVNIEGFSGTCYRFLEPRQESDQFYMKCEHCQAMLRISCPELEKLSDHLLGDHNIRLNRGKTIFYGTCSQCIEK